MENKTTGQQVWYLLLAGFFMFVIFSIFTPGNPVTTLQTPITKESVATTPSPQQIINIVTTPPQSLYCNNFDYTRWSHCSVDGTQSRVITGMSPEGCTLKNDTQSSQLQQCKYIPINFSAEDIINKMVGQIHNAPDQTIVTQYFTGKRNDVYMTTDKWKLSTDGTTLFLETTSKNRTSGNITDYIILADTDKDFRPDKYSDNGDNWYNISEQGTDITQNYTVIWALASSYFAAYLLND